MTTPKCRNILILHAFTVLAKRAVHQDAALRLHLRGVPLEERPRQRDHADAEQRQLLLLLRAGRPCCRPDRLPEGVLRALPQRLLRRRAPDRRRRFRQVLLRQDGRLQVKGWLGSR